MQHDHEVNNLNNNCNYDTILFKLFLYKKAHYEYYASQIIIGSTMQQNLKYNKERDFNNYDFCQFIWY